MNAKHRKTLSAVFKEPPPKQKSLKDAARVVRFHKDGEIATFHRPHPQKEAKSYQIEDARDFLIRIGVKS
jgi:hypothetical protein